MNDRISHFEQAYLLILCTFLGLWSSFYYHFFVCVLLEFCLSTQTSLLYLLQTRTKPCLFHYVYLDTWSSNAELHLTIIIQKFYWSHLRCISTANSWISAGRVQCLKFPGSRREECPFLTFWKIMVSSFLILKKS